MSNAAAAELTALEARDAIHSGAITAEVYIAQCLAAIEAREAEIQAWAYLDPALALAQARAVDAKRARGETLGPLAGLPVGIKDIIATADQPTENASAIFAGHRPERDAHCVAQLRAADAVVIGKTVTTEFATLTPNKTRNPHNPARTPGGSSSGSAAAVGAGTIPLALGTQTGGSVIRPASFCGIFGLKPTFGTIGRSGVTMQSHMLDTVGVYGRSIEDLALITDNLAAHDAADPQCHPRGRLELLTQCRRQPGAGPNFGFLRTPAWESDIEPTTSRLLTALVGELGKRAEEIALAPPFERVTEFHRVVMAAENAHYFRAYYERQGELLSPKLYRRIAEARGTPAMAYLEAIELREVCYRHVHEALGRFDALIVPAAPGPAPHGLGSTGNAIFNGLWTYLGVPCVTLPLLEADSMPIGVQLVGRRREDGKLLATTARWLAERMGKQRC